MDRARVVAEVDRVVVADHRRGFDGPGGVVLPADLVRIAVQADQLSPCFPAPLCLGHSDVDVSVRIDHRRGEHHAGHLGGPNRGSAGGKAVEGLVSGGHHQHALLAHGGR